MNITKTDMPWSELKAKLKQKYGQLMDDDFAFIEGKGEELLLRMQQRLGLTRTEAERIIDEIEGSGGISATATRYASEAKARLSTAAEDLRHKAEVGFDEVRDRTRRAFDQGRDTMRTYGNDAFDYVREHPASSLFCAVGFGFLLGVSMRRWSL